MLTQKNIIDIISSGRNHEAYAETVRIANKLKIHADGDTAGELISERRPGEDKEIKEYRGKIYEPITTSALSKVFIELGKIRRSSDWSIKFPEKSDAKIRKGETLQDYVEKNFPVYDSLTNWVFEELLKMYLIDPNSIIVVLPINFDKAVTDYYKPIPEVIPSENIIEFLDTEYCIVKSTQTGSYTQDKEVKHDAIIYYYIDKLKVLKVQRNGHQDSNFYFEEFPHALNLVPAFKLPGIFHKKIGKNKVNKSRIYGMVPFLNEATREYSDLQAEVVQHIHSTMWYYSNAPCKKCSGTGKCITKLPGADSRATTTSCTDCDGVGFVETSPYKQNFRVTPPSNINSHAIPTPPAGYIQKDIAIVSLQAKRVKEHIYDAMGVINMEYLMQVPLSESGTAKAYDRDGANNFVHYIAEDLVRVMDRTLLYINEWRYCQLLPNESSRKELLPAITVPEKYDLFNSQILLQQIKAAKDAGVNTVVINEMVKEYTIKYFNADPNVAKMLSAVLKLDPLVGYTIDEKISMVSSGLVQKDDAIISFYVQLFISQAVVQDSSFLDKSTEQKHLILKAFAKKKLEEMSLAESLKKEIVNPEPGS